MYGNAQELKDEFCSDSSFEKTEETSSTLFAKSNKGENMTLYGTKTK